MTRIFALAFALALLAGSASAQTPPSPSPGSAVAAPEAVPQAAAPAVTPAPPPVAVAVSSPSPAAGSAVPDASQLAFDAKAVVLASQQAAAATHEQKLASVLLALSLLFKLLLDAARRFPLTFIHNKQVVTLILCGLGLGVFLTANLAAGCTWWEALILGASGPVAAAVNALADLALPSEWTKAGEKAEIKVAGIQAAQVVDPASIIATIKRP